MVIAIGEVVWTTGTPCRCPEVHELCGGWLRIDQADPRILVSRHLLEQVLIYGSPHADLRPGPGAPEVPPPASLDAAVLATWIEEVADRLTGWVLTIRGENMTVVYRIGAMDPCGFTYEAEWPD